MNTLLIIGLIIAGAIYLYGAIFTFMLRINLCRIGARGNAIPLRIWLSIILSAILWPIFWIMARASEDK